MENDVTGSLHGMEFGTESSPTTTTEPSETTLRTASSGAVENVIASATPGPSSRLSAEEERTLARIRKDRANRFMVSVCDVDFLLEIVERLNR
jgi:hypothetical protein